jgi:hydroxymethylpyrimidine/phosphomethylpyrimidine kinase
MLLDEGGVSMLLGRLVPLVDWVTPNLDELGILGGVSGSPGEWSRARVVELGREVQGAYAGLGLVVTGGHMEPPDDLVSMRDGGGEFWLSGERIETLATHGTGCAFSSALLSRLVLGDEPLVAAGSAKRYVSEAMRSAVPRGRGRGPVNLLWPLRAI